MPQSDVQQWAWDAIDSGRVCAVAARASPQSVSGPLPPGMPHGAWRYCWASNSLEPEPGVDGARYISLVVQEEAQPNPEQAQPAQPMREKEQQKPTKPGLTAIGLAHAWIAENWPTDKHGRKRTDREVLREVLNEAVQLGLVDANAFSPDSSSLRTYVRAMIDWEIKLRSARRRGR